MERVVENSLMRATQVMFHMTRWFWDHGNIHSMVYHILYLHDYQLSEQIQNVPNFQYVQSVSKKGVQF